MKKVNIKNIEIDQQNDGIDIKMSLYNVQKYDRANFRTITANTILELEITNNRKSNLIVNSIGLGIIQSNELIKIFAPKKHSEKKEIANGQKATYFFHAYEIKLIFGRYKREEGIFLINTPKDDDYFYSSKISGDKLEQMISEMEDDDIGYNWGSLKITRLNQENEYDSVTRKLTYDYSNH